MEYNKVYSFLISPSDEIVKKVKGLKAFCAQLIGSFRSEHSKAHLTLSEPYAQSSIVMANRCRRWIQDLSAIPSSVLTINNFGYFDNPEGYVIYAKIEIDEFTEMWLKKLKSNFDNKSTFTPHITIARNLTKNQFNELWPYFSCMTYRQSFQVDHILVLENEIIKTAPDQLFKKIPLGSSNRPLQMPWTLFDSIS